MKRAKISFKYEGQKIPYILARHYIPDFILLTPTGKVYVECKGYLRPEDKSKLVAVRKCNPNMDLRIVFYSYNKKYIRWAEKVGIKWALEEVPQDWIDGL